MHTSPSHGREPLKNFETIEPPTIKEAWKKEKVRNIYFGPWIEALPLVREHPDKEK
jgi:hypothetical protein